VRKLNNELRDRAYLLLPSRGNVLVKLTNMENKIKVLLLFKQLVPTKKISFYYSIIDTLWWPRPLLIFRFTITNRDFIRKAYIEAESRRYHFYVIAPHFYDEDFTSWNCLWIIKKNPFQINYWSSTGRKRSMRMSFRRYIKEFARDINGRLCESNTHLREIWALESLPPLYSLKVSYIPGIDFFQDG